MSQTRISADQLFNMLSVRVFDAYCRLHSLLSKWLIDNKDVSQDTDLRRHYIYIVQFRDKVADVLDLLTHGDAEAKAKFIISKSKEVDDLERRISEFNAGNAGSAA